MEIVSANDEMNLGFMHRGCFWFKDVWKSTVSYLCKVARSMKSLGQEDPRRIIHSVKVGLAIAVVSLIYYFDPIYEGFGVSAMWAVMTVVVVFEFSVGATIGRGINRGIATLIGGALGVVAHRLASCFNNQTLQPIILALSIFLFAAMVTFLRFFSKLKARYDYGLLMCILTFCLICVSGYRDDEVISIAHTRVSTILVGGLATLLVCILIFPVWAGQDLQNLVSDNIERLGNFLEGFGDEYYKDVGDENTIDKRELLDEYKPVLASKTIEDSLANSAKWEPRHEKFKFRHPWGQYQIIGIQTRELAYRLDSLNVYFQTGSQTNPEIHAKFREPCKKMSIESSHALKKLAMAIRTMTSVSASTKSHINNAKEAANDLQLSLKTNPWQQNELVEVIPVATVASLLAEIVSFLSPVASSSS